MNRTRTVEKYFAFSVMTDNSGLFQSIQVLGDSGSQQEYLKQLRANLKAALVEGMQRFARVVVHTSFKLKRDEIDAIQKTVNQFAQGPDGEDCQFAVVKVNHKCRFFGVNRRVNSLVPYEGTTPRLGHREYLVWFEGIFPDKPTVTKAFPGPTHLEFLHVSDGARISDADLLQDIVNLSGRTGAGFNAKKCAGLGLRPPPGRRPGPRLPRARAAAAAGPAHPALVSLIWNMSTRSNDIMFLLGAGASADAGIPISAKMINKIENLLKKDPEWQDVHRPLPPREEARSTTRRASRARFGDGVPYNIETMVNSLYELERNEEHPLYPFIASWNSRFQPPGRPGLRERQDVSGGRSSAFSRTGCAPRRFSGRLLSRVRPRPERPELPAEDLHPELRHLRRPARPRGLPGRIRVRRLRDAPYLGLRTVRAGRGVRALQPPQVYLYKIHGSIDWKRDGSQNLYRVDQVQLVESDNMEIIFGRDFKLEAADPYLFYAYEFRRYCLLSKLIVSIGYSFGDAHINKMIAQALRADPERVLMVVTRCDKKDFQKKRNDISRTAGRGEGPDRPSGRVGEGIPREPRPDPDPRRSRAEAGRSAVLSEIVVAGRTMPGETTNIQWGEGVDGSNHDCSPP